VYPPPVWAGGRVKGRREKERKEKGKGQRMKGVFLVIRRGEAQIKSAPRADKRHW